jgi:hypothetical protein
MRGAFRKWGLIAASILFIILALLFVWYLLGQQNNSNNTGIGGKSASESQLLSKDPSIYAELQRNSYDTHIENRTAFMNQASQDFLNGGFYGNVTVINPGLGNYRQEPLNNQTVKFLGNCSLAYQLGYPRQNVVDEQRAANITQNDADTFNCNPIRLGDNSSHVDIVPVPYRLAWDLVQQTKQIKEGGFDVENHNGIGMALNVKAITNEWCLFDDPGGIKHYDSSINMSDPRVSDLTNTQWKLYLQASPLGGGKVYSDFTWWDSHNLRKNNTDENGLRAALVEIFYMPSATYSIKNQKMIYGMEAAKTSLTQAADELKAISSLYPNGKIQTEYMGLQDPRFHYYGEMDDRFHHGMNNTISAFVGGWDDSKVGHDPVKGNSYDWIQNQNGPDQFLTKNWPSWDLVKFIIGYERWTKGTIVEEINIQYIAPAVLRMAGFPVNHIGADIRSGNTTGATSYEYAIGLPQNIAQDLKASFLMKKYFLDLDIL